ncbi:Z-ring formation inhibitor MciZ [Gottfriedia sp. NPDC058432]|nr:Z-ring formation inhibitor MciZ [Bacillus sp. FJAT-25509]
MKMCMTENSVVLVGSKTEILKSLEVIAMQYKTVQEWIQNSNGKLLYVVK